MSWMPLSDSHRDPIMPDQKFAGVVITSLRLCLPRHRLLIIPSGVLRAPWPCRQPVLLDASVHVPSLASSAEWLTCLVSGHDRKSDVAVAPPCSVVPGTLGMSRRPSTHCREQWRPHESMHLGTTGDLPTLLLSTELTAARTNPQQPGAYEGRHPTVLLRSLQVPFADPWRACSRTSCIVPASHVIVTLQPLASRQKRPSKEQFHGPSATS